MFGTRRNSVGSVTRRESEEYRCTVCRERLCSIEREIVDHGLVVTLERARWVIVRCAMPGCVFPTRRPFWRHLNGQCWGSARTAGVGNLRKEHFEAQDQRQLQSQSRVAHTAVAPSSSSPRPSHTHGRHVAHLPTRSQAMRHHSVARRPRLSLIHPDQHLPLKEMAIHRGRFHQPQDCCHR
jgi:hypothetical protein